MSASLQVAEAVVSAATPAIIVPLTSVSVETLSAETRDAVAAGADLVEWRADHWLQEVGVHAGFQAVEDMLAVLRQHAGSLPLLFTIRTTAEGGVGPEGDAYAELLAQVILAGSADLVDIEFRRAGAQKLFALARERGVPTVASFHDFQATPPVEQITSILSDQEAMGASVAKVAVMPHSPADVATLLLATARQVETARIPVITMSMAAQGAVSRAAGHLFGSAASFGTAGAASAPGQIPVEDLRGLIDGISRVSEGS